MKPTSTVIPLGFWRFGLQDPRRAFHRPKRRSVAIRASPYKPHLHNANAPTHLKEARVAEAWSPNAKHAVAEDPGKARTERWSCTRAGPAVCRSSCAQAAASSNEQPTSTTPIVSCSHEGSNKSGSRISAVSLPCSINGESVTCHRMSSCLRQAMAPAWHARERRAEALVQIALQPSAGAG